MTRLWGCIASNGPWSHVGEFVYISEQVVDGQPHFQFVEAETGQPFLKLTWPSDRIRQVLLDGSYRTVSFVLTPEQLPVWAHPELAMDEGL